MYLRKEYSIFSLYFTFFDAPIDESMNKKPTGENHNASYERGHQIDTPSFKVLHFDEPCLSVRVPIGGRETDQIEELVTHGEHEIASDSEFASYSERFGVDAEN